MKKNNRMTVIAAVLLTTVMFVTAFAAFTKTAKYENGRFKDVAESSWYAKEVLGV